MKTVAIVQARTGSTRLPNKVMRPICGTPMIGLLLERLRRATRIDEIVLATSDQAGDAALARYVESLGCRVFRGSESDVLDRYYQSARAVAADAVVRITGDCPLVDAAIVDRVVGVFHESAVTYASNVAPPTYPDGLDTEVFTFQALESAWRETSLPAHREHVTQFIRESGTFTRVNVEHHEDQSHRRWTIDRPEDFAVVSRVFEFFHPRRDFGWLEVLNLHDANPDWFSANQHFVRNERVV